MSRFVTSTTSDYGEYVDGKPRDDGVRSFLASRDIELPEGGPDDGPGAETVNGLANRKNELFQRATPQRRGDGVRGLAALPAGSRATPACDAAVVSSSANTREVLEIAGLAELRRTAASTASPSARKHLAGKPAPDSFLRAAQLARRRARAGRRLRRRTVRGSGGPGRATSALVVGVDRRRARGSVAGQRRRPGGRRISASCWRHVLIGEAPFPSSPGVSARPTTSSICSPRPNRFSPCPTDTSDCAATSTKGEPHGLPGTYLNSFYEFGRCRMPRRVTAIPKEGQSLVDVTNGKVLRLLVDDEPFDVRYGELLEHERVLDLRAGTLTRHGRVALAGRQAGRGPLDPTGVAAPSAAWPPSSTSSRPSMNSPVSQCNPNWSPTRISRNRHDDPRVAAVLRSPLEPVAARSRGQPCRAACTAPEPAG